MSECYNTYFILNNDIRTCSEFDDGRLQHGISPYEVIRIIDGVPLFLEDHIERFRQSLASKDLEFCYDTKQLKSNIYRLLDENNKCTGNIKLLFNHQGQKQNCLLYFIKHRYPTIKEYSDGIELGVMHAIRENPNAKLLNKELTRTALNKKLEQGVYEVLLINHDSNITEGSMSNVFFIKDENVFTPPLASVLPGITRKYVISVCEELGFEVVERVINTREIKNFEAAFITGTSSRVLPVSAVEKTAFNSQNRVLRNIMEEFDKRIAGYIAAFSK